MLCGTRPNGSLALLLLVTYHKQHDKDWSECANEDGDHRSTGHRQECAGHQCLLVSQVWENQAWPPIVLPTVRTDGTTQIGVCLWAGCHTSSRRRDVCKS